MQNTPPAAAPLTILNGGVEIVVRFIDGRPEELVKVRQIAMRHMAQYGNAQGDEGALLDLFTGKDAAWVDNLTQESQEEIVVIGDQLNLDPFFRWSTRRLTANKQLEPLAKLVSASAKSAALFAPAVATPPSSSSI